MRRPLTLVLAALGVALVVSACGYEGTTTPKPSSVDGQAVSRNVGAKAPAATTPATTAPASTAPATTAPTNTAPTTATGDAAAAGKQIFTSMGCSACHTLKDAGATGTIGPNLDLLKPKDALVVLRVTNGGSVMPPFKDRLSAKQIADVAAYVSSVAGK